MRKYTRQTTSKHRRRRFFSLFGSSQQRPTVCPTRDLRVESLERRQLLAAETLQITVENLADAGGLGNTPLWIAAHDGSFDVADLNSPASDFGGLELIAEEGDPSELVARFAAEGSGNDAVILAPDGFPGAPVFEAGEQVSTTFVVDDPLLSRYFSFASMVIPSNDAFLANLDARAYPIFDVTGAFTGPLTITLYGSDIWDSGTEINDELGGAAFTTSGGTSVDENGVIARHSGLDQFIGADLPTGSTLERAFGPNTPVARITVSRASNPSNPIDTAAPRAALQVGDLRERSDDHEITVTYSDASGIDPNSLTIDDIRVTGPSLTQLEVLSVETDAIPGTVPREVTATYRVSPTSGSFTALDNGTYSVVLLDNAVNDVFGQETPAQQLGEFVVEAPVRVQVTYENLSDLGGLSATPVFVAAHEGNFEVARAGSPASDFAGLEILAEEGDVAELIGRFQAESDGTSSVILAPDGFTGAPVFEPGESVVSSLDVFDPARNRFFSFASMVIPSNDAFFANLDPRAYELFDASGEFTGARSITVYGRDVWDAGTEVNAASGGAAFSTEGGVSTDENGAIRRHDGLDDFVGTGTPIGTLASAFESMTPIGRFTISLADIPASPVDNQAPASTANAATLDITGQSTHEVRVTYSDPTGVDVTSIDTSDIRVTPLFGSEPLRVVGVTADTSVDEDSRTVTATYEIARADGGLFTSRDNGLYAVELVDSAVGDTFGNDVERKSLGTLEILIPVQLRVTIENLANDGGLYQTPFWVGVHEGNFQTAGIGDRAENFGGLELLAEEGDPSLLVNRFASQSDGVDTVVLGPDGFPGAPVFDPGETASQILEVADTNVNRFFGFASMLIPSNDAFFANLNSRAYELFDESGFFLGEQTITLTGRDVLDGGTEINGVGQGAAFSTAGGDGVDESGVIRRHAGLDEFIGSGLPTNQLLEEAFNRNTPLARITIGLADETQFPIDQDGPTVTVATEDVLVAGTPSHQIQVTYNDPSGVDPTTIDTDDIRIIGPLGRQLEVTGVVIDAAVGETPTSVVATYTVTTTDNQLIARDNGRYLIDILPDAVGDSLGLTNENQIAGEFRVDVGVRVQVTIRSLTEAGGLAQTPFWVGFHDGSFEVARSGVPAANFAGLELLAEEGDPSELAERFEASGGTDTVITSPAGFPGAPVFEPGEAVSQVIEVDGSKSNAFFSFASMIIPSNDAFVANRNPLQYRLFDNRGNFQGARQITLYGRDILDAGTEQNDPFGGAAYSTEGGDSIDEGGVIRRHSGLDEFVGTGVPTGSLASAFSTLTPIATITVSLFDPEADVCSGVDSACSSRSVTLQNALRRSDVNRDGRVSALDSLLIVNFLGRFGSQSTITDEVQATGLDLDVGGDQRVSALDALIVVNDLARNAPASPSPEGESSSAESSDADSIAAFDSALVQLTGSDLLNDEDEELSVASNSGVLF